MDLEVVGNKIVKVHGKKGHPVSDGFLCQKGRRAHEWVDSPDRLSKPRLRSGEKFIETDWQTAINHSAKELKRIRDTYGPNSIGFLSSARCTSEENYLMVKFAAAVIGTNNVDSCARLCHSTTAVALAQNLGSGVMTNSIAEAAMSDCLFILGSNTTSSHPLVGTKMMKGKKERGTKIIVVDPRRTDIAKKADIHLQIRPGTDTALVNAMMRVILEEGLEDMEFVKTRTKGFEYLTRIVRRFTPEHSAEICGVDKDDIIAAAKMYGGANVAAIYYTMGITQHPTGVENIVNLSNLAMLTGNFGKEGGGVNPLRGQNNVQGSGDVGALPDCHPGYKVVDEVNTRHLSELWGVDTLPYRAGITSVEMMEAIPEKIRAVVVMGENPALAHPALEETRTALNQLEFLLVMDVVPTDTTKLATVVLPAACWAEKDGTFTNSERRVQRVRRAIPSPGESKADWQIICDLAAAMGKGELFPYQHPSEIFDEIRKAVPQYSGLSYERIDKAGIPWPCNDQYPNGKPYIYDEKFFTEDGLGKFFPIEYTQPREKVDDHHDFIMITGRIPQHYHGMTMTGRCPSLMKLAPEAFIEVNPEDAAINMIEEGDMLRVSSRMGAIEVKARLTDDVKSGHCFVPFHYSDAPVNMLTIPNLDPIGKTPGLKVTPVKLEPVVSGFGEFHPEGVVSQKDNILAVLLYNCMLRYGWTGEKIDLGNDAHNLTFVKVDKPDHKMVLDLERIECFLDIKAHFGDGNMHKRIDMDDYVSDTLETRNTRQLMKLVYTIIRDTVP